MRPLRAVLGTRALGSYVRGNVAVLVATVLVLGVLIVAGSIHWLLTLAVICVVVVAVMAGLWLFFVVG